MIQKRKIAAVVLSLSLAFIGVCTPQSFAYAAQPDYEVMPCYNNMADFNAKLTVDSSGNVIWIRKEYAK